MLGSREVSVNEIWPRVPWAPSHSCHVMHPRITRNSYRPRASDRTMVDFESPFALSLSQTRPRPLTRLRRLIRMGARQTSPGKPHYRGLDLEKTSRLRSRQKFFLDIPFNRTRLRRLIRMGARQTSPGKPHYRGLDLEKTSRLRSRQKFFLDIPFNRTQRRRF